MWMGIALMFLFGWSALFAPLLAPHDPTALDLAHRLASPGAAHWFGTDELGRDIFSRILFGARISLTVAICVVSLSLTIGLLAGLAAGFYGGWVEIVLNVYVTESNFSCAAGHPARHRLRMRFWGLGCADV